MPDMLMCVILSMGIRWPKSTKRSPFTNTYKTMIGSTLFCYENRRSTCMWIALLIPSNLIQWTRLSVFVLMRPALFTCIYLTYLIKFMQVSDLCFVVLWFCSISWSLPVRWHKDWSHKVYVCQWTIFDGPVHFPTREKNTLVLILTTLPGQFKDVHSPDKLSDHDIVSGTLKTFIPPIKKPRNIRKVIMNLWEKTHLSLQRKNTSVVTRILVQCRTLIC